MTSIVFFLLGIIFGFFLIGLLGLMVNTGRIKDPNAGTKEDGSLQGLTVEELAGLIVERTYQRETEEKAKRALSA